jgi:hypothetical protein
MAHAALVRPCPSRAPANKQAGRNEDKGKKRKRRKEKKKGEERRGSSDRKSYRQTNDKASGNLQKEGGAKGREKGLPTLFPSPLKINY